MLALCFSFLFYISACLTPVMVNATSTMNGLDCSAQKCQVSGGANNSKLLTSQFAFHATDCRYYTIDGLFEHTFT